MQEPLQDTTTDIALIDSLNSEAWKINRTDPRRGVELSKQAFELAEANEYLKGKAYALSNWGACQVWLGNYEESLEHSFEALRLLLELNDKQQMCSVQYSVFCVFYFLNDYDNALKHILEGYRLAEQTDDRIGKANSLNGIGTVYYTTGDNEKAVEHLKEGFAIAKELGEEQIQAKILDGLGSAYYNLGDFDNALRVKFECLEIAQRLGIKQVHSYALDGIGKAYSGLGKFEESIGYFEKSLSLRKEMGFRAGEAETLLHLGETYFQLQKYESALCYLTEALELATEVDAKETIYRTHKVLSEFFELQGDFVRQIDHLKKYYQLKEEHFSQRQSQKQRSLEMQFRMERMEKEKELLENKNKELETVFSDVVLLSEIGRRITASLSVEDINQIIYESLSSMMDAPSFGMGIYNDVKNMIQFPGYIEDGKILYSEYDVNDGNRLAPVCFSQEKEILIGDLEKELQLHVPVKMAPVAGRHVTSLIYLPVKVNQKKVGVITVQSYNKNAYTEYHLNLLRNLAVYAGIALENAKLYEGLEEMVQERSAEVIRQKEEIERSYYNTQLLSEIGQQITSTLNIAVIFNELYQNVNKLMPAECFGVRIYKPEEHVIEYKYEVERGVVDTEGFSVSMDNIDNYSVWCVRNREVVFLNDNQNEYHKYTSKIVVPTGEMPHSLIFYPMIVGDKVLGVITVQSFEKFAYKPYHIDILKTLGTYTAIALENANLYENLEVKVAERTLEVVAQKEEIEKNHRDTELLSAIGQEITSSLSVEAINQQVFEKVNTMMDAPSFGIGLYDAAKDAIVFPGYIEEGLEEEVIYTSDDQDRLAWLCFNQEREIMIGDYDAELTNYVARRKAAVAGRLPNSVIYIPLKTTNKKIGVLTAQSFSKNAYTEYHLNLLRNLSVYVAIALDNAGLYEGLEDKVEQRTAEIRKAYDNTRLLAQIQQDIISSLSVETIISKVYENVNTLMDATSFGIGIFDEESRHIIMPGFIESGVRMEEFSYSVDDPNRLAAWCFNNQKEIFINNYYEEYSKYITGIKKAISGKDSTSIIYLPLMANGKQIGVITVQSYELNAYTEYHLDLLRSLAASAAIAIDNARLYENLEYKVRERTAEVVKQKEVIEEKNKHITDSIVYAKRIQEAILPPEDVFKLHLRNSFVLYKPKDIVSGDFYWIERKENKILFAVVDCTGHGVPGAFMSIIGYNGLNQIVNEYNITQPAEILNNLNRIISATLKQRAEESKIRDGMDLSVCSIDLENHKLEYAGANNPIFIVRNNEVIEVKADKQPIGNFVGEEDFRFTNKEIDLLPNDRLYVFSDGYADQFGGPRGKKLKYSTFRDLLIENCDLPMEEQKRVLDQMFETWRGDLEQIDDVCVIGVGI
ncbi:MAG TPA: hypothetical protein DEP18_03680 [Flavobacteriales bacterium]|nr:hypothetical protein [Flavobacteriales bacterium]HRE75375.1 GAF domain-containing protein [Flavobacteriales bacterium]HRE95797.1 GAF domain-containing protein [Flavobacteriales bacterium]HRJ37565.1 GAF domain-containing protein [Flavobacteriales bacterium]